MPTPPHDIVGLWQLILTGLGMLGGIFTAGVLIVRGYTRAQVALEGLTTTVHQLYQSTREEYSSIQSKLTDLTVRNLSLEQSFRDMAKDLELLARGSESTSSLLSDLEERVARLATQALRDTTELEALTARIKTLSASLETLSTRMGMIESGIGVRR